MTVADYFKRLTYYCLIHEALPQGDGNPLLTDHDKLHIAFMAMPKAFRTEYKKQGRRLTQETFETLQNFMQLMEETLPKPTTTTFTSTKALKDFRTTKDSPNL